LQIDVPIKLVFFHV